MSDTQSATGGASTQADRSRQNAGAAPPTKSGNPARPSKFAGLNLRPRADEQPTAGEAEPDEQRRGGLETAAPTDPRAEDAPTAAPPLGTTVNSASAAPSAESPIVTAASATTPAQAPAQHPAAALDRLEQTRAPAEQRQQSVSAQPHAGGERNRRSQEPQSRTTHHSEHGDDGEGNRVPARRRGKRTDPEYVQVTAYIRQETYRRARIKLLESSKPQEFSEVVEELLTRWLRAPA